MMRVISFSLVFLSVSLFLSMPIFGIAGNILLVPIFIGEGSHFIAMDSIATELVNRGHNITMLVPRHYKDKLSSRHREEGYHFESFTPFVSHDILQNFLQNMTRESLKGKYTEWIRTVPGSEFEQNQVLECRTMLGDKDLMSRLLNSNFDLAVEDMNHLCPVVQYLRKTTGIPYVALSLVLTIPNCVCLANRWPFNPSYMPEILSAYDHVMSFQERLINTRWTLFVTGLMNMLGNSHDELRHDFGIADTTPYYDDAELYLINSHFSLDFPKPTLPNTVMIGGFTTGPGQLLDTVST